jgi:hypothetical protein
MVLVAARLGCNGEMSTESRAVRMMGGDVCRAGHIESLEIDEDVGVGSIVIT